MTLEFRIVSMDHPDASMLLDELCLKLTKIVGHDGTMFLRPSDFSKPRAMFAVGYLDGDPICCAGVREMNSTTGEVRRVYARRNNVGAARQFMTWLEQWAIKQKYSELRLECRNTNPHAIEFYKQNGYSVCEKYGPYIHESDAVCMKKAIS